MRSADQNKDNLARAHKLFTSLPGWLSAQANVIEGMSVLPSKFEQFIVEGRNVHEAGCESRLEGFDIQAKSYLELVCDRPTLAAYLVLLDGIREGELNKVQRTVDHAGRVFDPLCEEIVQFESGLAQRVLAWTARAYRLTAKKEEVSATTGTNGEDPDPRSRSKREQHLLPYQAREENLRVLAKDFRKAAEAFRSLGFQLRGEFFATPGNEQFGIWRLRPSTRESEFAREKFRFLASLTIREIGLSPIQAPEPREFDPTWSDELDRVEGKERDREAPETVPSGLNAVDECTRAWLRFLHVEGMRRKASGYTYRADRYSIPDIWEASAVECERIASDRIAEQLLGKPQIGKEAADPGQQSEETSNPSYAVCPAIVPGKNQTPQVFSSKEDAEFWLSERTSVGLPSKPPPRNSVVADSHNTSECDKAKLENFVSVDSVNERWNLPIRVSHIKHTVVAEPFQGSIGEYLVAENENIPETPSLDETIQRHFDGSSPEIECFLGEDWHYEKIAISPRVRRGLANLVKQDGISKTAARFVLKLQESLKLQQPNLEANAIADFWRSWQNIKHIADFCFEAGPSKQMYSFLRAQVAAFAQSAADSSVPRSIRTASNELSPNREETVRGNQKSVSPGPQTASAGTLVNSRKAWNSSEAPEYPRWLYHPAEKPKMVSGPQDEVVLGPEWSRLYIHQEYPKVKYHWSGKEITIQTAGEESALGGGWANTPAALAPYKGPRTAGTEHHPEQWVDEWPIAGFSAEIRKKIKARLWKADSEYWKSPDTPSADTSAMQLAFDGVADVLFSAGILTEDLLRDQIPLFVWDSAMAAGWWRLASETPQEMFREKLGHYWVWREEGKDWQGLFRSETGKWRAQLLEHPPVPREPPHANAEPEAGTVARTAEDSKPPENQSFTELLHSVAPLPEFSEQASRQLITSASHAVGFDGFASEAARISALAEYRKRWACPEAALARKAFVHPADLSKWKRGSLPARSEKKARIEKALRKDERPDLRPQSRPKDS